MLIKRGVIPLSYLKPSWDNGLAGQLEQIYAHGVDYVGTLLATWQIKK